MAFTYDENLADAVSRTRRLLLDTDEDTALLTDEAIATYHTLYGVDEGTAKLAMLLLNEWGNQPTQGAIEGVEARWADRLSAWQAVIADIRAFPLDPAAARAATVPKRYRTVAEHDPYRGRPIHRGRRGPPF